MKLRTLCAATALTWAAAAPAHAVVLTPGSGAAPLDIVAVAPGGTVLASLSSPISASTWSGQFRTAVVDGPEAGVNLDFYYQIVNDASSQDPVQVMLGQFFNTPLDFVGPYFTTDVVQTAAAFDGFLPGAQPAALAARTIFGYGGFQFLPGCACHGLLDPGETSYTFIVRTNAAAYDDQGLVGIFDGAVSVVQAFQPAGQPPLVGPVPEPGTWGLLAAGILAIGGMRRRCLVRHQ